MKYDKPVFSDQLATGLSFEERFTQAGQIPEDLLQFGSDFVKRGKVKYQTIDSLVSSTSEVTGTVQCGFGIVHHPSIMTVRRRDKVLVPRFHCGCREGSRDHFCIHCAALVQARFAGMDVRVPEDDRNAEADLRGIRIRLGTGRKTEEPIYWLPEAAERVSTPNLAVIGGADTGNTQVMKSIALQFLRQRQGMPGETGLLVLDWMGDYDESKNDFLEATGARARKLQKLPLDPFSLLRLERKPQLHVHRAMSFADTLARAYGLGPLDKSTLVQSVVAAYDAKGITSDPVTWNRPAPTFADVYEEYFSRPQAQRSDALSAVMDGLAAFELFDSAPSQRTTAMEMFRGVEIIDMSGYPAELQSFAAGIMLEQFYAQLCGSRRSRSSHLTKMLLIDEADELLDMGCPGLEGLLRRSRDYGLAVVLAAQDPKRFCGGFDWWQVIRTWVIHNAEELYRPELETLLQPDSHEFGLERLYQQVKHQIKLQSLIRIGTEEPVLAEDLPFYEIVQDKNQNYLKERQQEVRPLPLEGMPLLDKTNLDAVDITDDLPPAPMEELTEI